VSIAAPTALEAAASTRTGSSSSPAATGPWAASPGPGDGVGVKVALEWPDDDRWPDHPADDLADDPADDSLADWFFSEALIDGPTRDFGPRPPARRQTDDRGGHDRWRRPVVVVAAALLSVVVGAGTVVALRHGGPAEPSGVVDVAASSSTAAPDRPVTETVAETVAAAGVVATTVPDSPTGCPTSHDEAARLGIGAACAANAHTEGNHVVVGTLTWEVGAAEDVAAVGDFTCDGWLDAAALDRDGNVFLFERWAADGDDAPSGRLISSVPAAHELRVAPGSLAACPVVAVVPLTGDAVVLTAADLR
jgi:hypothetical protein